MEFLKDLSIDKVRNLAEDTLNQVKPKTEVEARVYEVLSHKNWGSSSSLMHEIARDTRDVERFHVVTRIMWESMENQRPAAWRIVFKGLTLLEFLVKNGAERCVDDARGHGHVLRSLLQFNYYEGTVDRGVGVREKSKQLLEMLSSDGDVREERQRARKLRDKFSGKASTASSAAPSNSGGYGNQDSWNSSGGGGYGEGGIDSGYGKGGGGYSGRYGGSRASPSSAADPSSAPTFAAIPPKKRKGKKKAAAKETPAPEVPQPEVDLFSFDDPAPAPVPAPAGDDDDFGAFAAAAAAPAPAKDDFADFGGLRSAPAPAAGPDPFAATPAPAMPSQQQAFDAFGGSAAATGAVKAIPPPTSSATTGVSDAFANMSMGTQQPQAAAAFPAPAAADDDFGDFSSAAPKPPSAAKANPADPMAKLVSLDHLSKNLSPPKSANRNGSGAFSMNQFQQNPNPVPAQNGMVSVGGSDAISNMMGPQSQMMPGMQQGGMGGQANPQMTQQMMGMQQGGMQGMNQMGGGMQGGMGGQQMMGGMNQMGMGGMNQMGGMQGNMGMGGMNQMNGGMQGNMGMGGMNQMNGGMHRNMGMGGMNQMGNMQGGQQQWR